MEVCVCVWVCASCTYLSRLFEYNCMHTPNCMFVCVQITDPSRGELLWMLFCSNYSYLFPLKQANCRIAARAACTRIDVYVDLFASLFIVCLCRIADPSNFFSMDTFSLWRQNSSRRSCWATIWLFSQLVSPPPPMPQKSQVLKIYQYSALLKQPEWNNKPLNNYSNLSFITSLNFSKQKIRQLLIDRQKKKCLFGQQIIYRTGIRGLWWECCH